MINYMKNQNDTNRTYDTEGASQPKPSSHAEETQNGRKKKKRKKKRYLLKLSVLLLAAAAVFAYGPFYDKKDSGIRKQSLYFSGDQKYGRTQDGSQPF